MDDEQIEAFINKQLSNPDTRRLLNLLLGEIDCGYSGNDNTLIIKNHYLRLASDRIKNILNQYSNHNFLIMESEQRKNKWQK